MNRLIPRPLAAGAAALVLAAGVFCAYFAASATLGQGEIVLPLDDTYIHFQYARQLALGHPYEYNTGDPPTSGATSFLYPYLLAAGYLLGFTGLRLGAWALLLGGMALLGSTILVYRLSQLWVRQRWIGLVTAAAFCTNGAVGWHFMSGMETGLMVTLTLAVLYAVAAQRFGAFVLAATLLALTRPEGGLLALLAVIAFYATARRHALLRGRPSPWLLLPIAAMAVQPLLNLALTGSISASGSQAKSVLSTIPFYWEVAAARLWGSFVRFWAELATGTGGRFMPGAVPLLGVVGLGWLLVSRRTRPTGLMIVGWWIVGGAAIATLDTAFWHFKRYQMPLLALAFPLAAWGFGWLWRMDEHVLMRRLMRGVTQRSWLDSTTRIRVRLALPPVYRALRAVGFAVLLLILLGRGLVIATEFHRLYRVNVQNVVVQPLAMARWLAENTPADAVVAVHDVGMMRYVGDRYTLDMVGLTTPGAADAWRNGPGAVAEFLLRHQPPPDYVAAYTTARGLNYLVDSVYGDELARFPAVYHPADNVALAAEVQGIYTFCCVKSLREQRPDPATSALVGAAFGWSAAADDQDYPPVDSLDVASLESERAHAYAWQDRVRTPGFATEVYRFSVPNCTPVGGDACFTLDGGRRMNGEESFTLAARPNEDALLVTRLHPVNAGTFDVYVEDRWVDRRWIPAFAGRWLDVLTLIPGDLIAGDALHVRIVPQVGDGHYMPYAHWLWQGQYQPVVPASAEQFAGLDVVAPAAAYQGGAFTVRAWMPGDGTIRVAYETDGSAEGDYKLFVHVYTDPDHPPIAQFDSYPGTDSSDEGGERMGTTPPGNWLPGVISDTIRVDLTLIPPGRYQVALGFYEARTFERLVPALMTQETQYRVDEAGRRLFIGEMVIPEQ